MENFNFNLCGTLTEDAGFEMSISNFTNTEHESELPANVTIGQLVYGDDDCTWVEGVTYDGSVLNIGSDYIKGMTISDTLTIIGIIIKCGGKVS